MTILPVEPYSTMAMVLNSDGRPGYRTATILDVVGWPVEGNVMNVYPGCSNYSCEFNSIGVILYYVQYQVVSIKTCANRHMEPLDS